MSAIRRFTIPLLFVSSLVSTAFGQDSIEFNRDIRPILNDACFACHGPDSASRKGELRLDQRDAAVEKAAIVEGKPDESEMIRRILSDNPGGDHASARTQEDHSAREQKKLLATGSKPAQNTSSTGRISLR